VASQFDRHPTNRIVSLKPARLSVARASNARRLEDRMPLRWIDIKLMREPAQPDRGHLHPYNY
jgi:hypothetical protein